MDFETQDALTKTVSEDISDDTLPSSPPPVVEMQEQEESPVTTTFSRLRQKRRAFGSVEKSNAVSVLEKSDDSDAPLSLNTEHEFALDAENDDNGSGIFGGTQSATGSIGSDPFKMTVIVD